MQEVQHKILEIYVGKKFTTIMFSMTTSLALAQSEIKSQMSPEIKFPESEILAAIKFGNLLKKKRQIMVKHVKQKFKNKVGIQVKNQVCSQVANQQVHNQIFEKVGNQIWDQIWEQCWSQVWDQT